MRAEWWPSFLKSVNASLTSAADPLQPFFAFSGLEKRYPFTLRAPSPPRPKEPPNKQAFPWLRAITRVDQRLTTPAFEFPPWRTSIAKQIGQGASKSNAARGEERLVSRGERERRQYAVNSRGDHAWPSFDLFPCCTFPSSILFMDYVYGGMMPRRGASPRLIDRYNTTNTMQIFTGKLLLVPRAVSRTLPRIYSSMECSPLVKGEIGRNKEQIDLLRWVITRGIYRFVYERVRMAF